MTYSELAKEIEQLSYRDKFRLAQLLIQLARKEEEEQKPEQRQNPGPTAKLDAELVQYVAGRLRKLKPSKKEALFNSIAAMFQFQGGISDGDKERMFLSCRSEDTSSLRRTVVFSIQRSNTHSTGAQIARLSSARLNAWFVVSRPAN